MVLGEFFFRCGRTLVWDSLKQLFAEVADSNAPNIHVRVRRLTREVKQLMKEGDYFHKLALN